MNKNEFKAENYDKRANINIFDKINKKVHFSKGNNNFKLNSKQQSYNVSSYENMNRKPNIKNSNYRQKLLKRCNSQILNKEIIPILTNNLRYSYNNVEYSCKNKEKIKKIPLIKSPNISQNIYNLKLNKIHFPILSNSHNISTNKIRKKENKKNYLAHSVTIHKILNYEKKKSEIKNKISNDSREKNKKINENRSIDNFQKLQKSSGKSNLEDANNIKQKENKGINGEKDIKRIGVDEENNIKKNEVFEENNNEKNDKIEKLYRDLQPKRRPYKYRPYKFSKFYKLSKNRNVSARNIYEYYISEEIKDDNIPDPIDNFTKFIEKKYRNPNKKFDKLYGIKKSHLARLQEIKNNNSIAYKEDFDLKEYQNILCGMIKKRVRNDNIYILKEDFKKFNEKLNNGFLSHKGRFSQLAEKIRYNAPSYLVDKLKKLDEEKIKAKARYFNINLNKKKDADIDYALEDFDYYLENKFVPNIDIK